jgi:alpha-glucosidase
MQSIVCVFNFTGQAANWPEEANTTGRLLASVNGAELGRLPPFGALLIEERT